MAIVILKDGISASKDEVMEWVNAKLAKYQRISMVHFRDTDFPRNALGKVLKRELREVYQKTD
jgi:acyl-coenzyme A synthetase/AMP-(fatty) acid ligase